MTEKIGKYEIFKTDDGNLIVSGKSKEIRTISVPEGNYLEVRGAWYLDQFPTKIIIELMDGSLESFDLSPFKKITYRDLRQYKGHHPSKIKGHSLPEMLYQYYGLAHTKETMSEVVKIRLKPSEKFKLDAVATNRDVTVSEVIRDYIRSI